MNLTPGEVAPKTRSSRLGCVQKGRLKHNHPLPGSFRIALRWECFGWQIPCHFGCLSWRSWIWLLSTREAEGGQFREVCPYRTSEVLLMAYQHHQQQLQAQGPNSQCRLTKNSSEKRLPEEILLARRRGIEVYEVLHHWSILTRPIGGRV